MDDKLNKIMELSRDPMLAVEGGKLCGMNSAARALFPGTEIGDCVPPQLPEQLLSTPSESFFSSAVIGKVSYCVSALRDGETLLLSLTGAPVGTELRGYLSDALINSMLSSMFTIGLSSERIRDLSAGLVPEADGCFSALLHNYYKLNHMLFNLKTLCDFGDGSMLIVPRHTDLTTLCRDLVSSVNCMTLGRTAPVEYVCTLETLSACVDSPKVERLILNLLSNALQHTEKDGTVRLRLSRTGSSAVISVDDDGCGIPPEKLKTVFRSYENRLTGQNLSDPGTGGLGLGICRAIVEKHGGTLILESRVGEGTSVRVLLPLTQPDDAVLRSDLSVYESGGLPVLLTELCDVLDAEAYTEKYLD